MSYSALDSVINKLKNGERLSDEAIAEIDRTLSVLLENGWSGSIPADKAAEALAEDARKYQDLCS